MQHKFIAKHLLDGATDTAIAAGMEALEHAGAIPKANVLYMEPRMAQRTGHFSRLADCYQDLLNQHKLTTTLLHSDRWKDSRVPGWLGALSLADHAIAVGGINTEQQLSAFTDYYHAITASCLEATQAQLTLLPTARFLNVAGVLSAVAQAPNSKAAIIGVMETFPVPDCADESLVDAAFTRAAAMMRSSQKHFLLLAESEPIRTYLLSRGFAAEWVHVHPYPVAGRFLKMAPEATKNNQLRLGCMGASRAVQNPALLADYLLNQSNPAHSWSVKLNVHEAAISLNSTAGQITSALAQRGIKAQNGALSNAAYDAEFMNLDVMVFPYGERYQTIGSGIFLECISAGVIPLLPRQSTMRKAYLDLGGEAPAIASMTTQGLGDSIDRCAEMLPLLRENAQAVRKAWSEHPQGPQAWEDRIGRFLPEVFSTEIQIPAPKDLRS
jgi:hypothetical protein